MAIHFDWDEEKAARNIRKHSISFAEVTSLFTSGMEYLEIFDTEHSHDEERFICIGPIARGIVLVVIVDMGTDLIRIISARHATRRESLLYEQFLEERSHD
ncbi:MAG: BrnT family toxin [Planctomycetaceae bacterium]